MTRRLRPRLRWLAAVLAIGLGCGAGAPGEPDHIKVQHVLIGFRGSVPGKTLVRSREEAASVAREVFDRARKGEDFDRLVRIFTDDRFPGIYEMANHGVEAPPGVAARSGMVPAFGDVGFALAVGEVGLAEYDPATAPYGWHVIKRLE